MNCVILIYMYFSFVHHFLVQDRLKAWYLKIFLTIPRWSIVRVVRCWFRYNATFGIFFFFFFFKLKKKPKTKSNKTEEREREREREGGTQLWNKANVGNCDRLCVKKYFRELSTLGVCWKHVIFRSYTIHPQGGHWPSNHRLAHIFSFEKVYRF